MKFKGTIIITDPCYVVKNTEDRLKEAGITIKYPDFDGNDLEAYKEAIDKYYAVINCYDDWRTCDYGDRMDKLGFTYYISKPTLCGDWGCTTWSTPRNDIEKQVEELNKLYKDSQEAEEKYGSNAAQSKMYEDKWAEAFVNMKELGAFCADAGMVAVFLLEEVLKYNPDFSKWIEEHPWCVTVIPDFDGDIQYHIDEDGDAHIIGKGNINFLTSQTGL